jgi:hypothetical protein
MSISIRNPRVDRKARELARLTGKTITQAIGDALDELSADIASRPAEPVVDSLTKAVLGDRRDGDRGGD